MKVKFKRLHQKAQLPKLQTKGAACVDLVMTEVEYNYITATVKFGFASEIPEGYKVVMVPRSSLTKSSLVVQNSPCQIDSDYRGEWMMVFRLVGEGHISNYFPYKKGDRVAQCYLEKVIPLEFEEAEELSQTERLGGFGSTGN